MPCPTRPPAPLHRSTTLTGLATAVTTALALSTLPGHATAAAPTAVTAPAATPKAPAI